MALLAVRCRSFNFACHGTVRTLRLRTNYFSFEGVHSYSIVHLELLQAWLIYSLGSGSLPSIRRLSIEVPSQRVLSRVGDWAPLLEEVSVSGVISRDMELVCSARTRLVDLRGILKREAPKGTLTVVAPGARVLQLGNSLVKVA